MEHSQGNEMPQNQGKETTPSPIQLSLKDSDILRFWFINQENHALVSEYVRQVSEKVFQCLLSEKAVINSNIGLREIAPLFPIQGFPTTGNSLVDFSQEVLTKWPVINFGTANFFWQMHPARNIPAIIAGYTSSLLNQNLIAEEVSPVFTQMENQVIGYLSDIIGYNIHESWGSVTSGGTIANLTAMMVARNTTLGNDGDGVAENGIQWALEKYNQINGTSYTDVELFVWEDNHYSIEKLAWYTGIGSKKIRTIPYKKGWFTLDTDFLRSSIEEAEARKKLIIGIFITAGTTEKGHIHDIAKVIDIAKNIGQNGRAIYVHTDAAHGWGFLVDEELKNEYFQWIEDSDSVTIDGHKMFYTNYACWCIVFKNKKSLECVKHSAKYIMDENSLNENHGQYTIEWSRSTGGVFQLWSSIQSFWRDGYTTLVRKTIDTTRAFRELLEQENDFEILSWDSPLNLICFRYRPLGINDEEKLNQVNSLLKEQMYSDGQYYVWDTTIDDKKCFKAVFVNPEIQRTSLTGFIEKIRELYIQQQ